MAGTSSPSASPSSKSRGGGIRKFVRRVASFASGRSNGRESKTTGETKTPTETTQEQNSTPPRSSPPRSLNSKPEAVTETLPPPPGIEKSLSSSSSATATSQTQQPTQLGPGRDNDATSYRSEEFSEESSFSGLSALPSDYGHSVTSSPEQVLGQLSRSSLVQRLSSSETVDMGNTSASRVDPAVGTVVLEPKRPAESPRVSMPSELYPVLESPTTEPVLESSEHSEHASTDSPPESDNTLQLDVIPTETPAPVEAHDPVDAIPALGSLVQLDSEFGANSSSSILCPAEDNLEIPEISTSAVATEVVENTPQLAEELEAAESSGTDEQELPLPQEPTLPAVPESSNDAVPDDLDLDTVAEADIYAVGCSLPVTETLTFGDVRSQQTMIECFALALPFEELQAEVENELADMEFVFNEEGDEEEGTVEYYDEYPLDDARDDDMDRPHMRPCPPPEVDELVRAELGSRTPSEIATPRDMEDYHIRVEEKVEEFSAGSVEVAALPPVDRPHMRPCPPPEIDELVRAELGSQTPSELATPEDVEVLPVQVEERLEELSAASITKIAPIAVEKGLPQQTATETAALATQSLGPVSQKETDIITATTTIIDAATVPSHSASVEYVSPPTDLDIPSDDPPSSAVEAMESDCAAPIAEVEEAIPPTPTELPPAADHPPSPLPVEDTALPLLQPEQVLVDLDSSRACEAVDHSEERPVLERLPSMDDEKEVAAILEELPPLEVTEDAVIDDDDASLPPNDSDPEDRDNGDSSADGCVQTPDHADEDSQSSSPAEFQTSQEDKTGDHSSCVEPVVSSLASVREHDLPELIPCIPSSSSSESGDDEPEHLTLAYHTPAHHAAHQVIANPKHLPIAFRSVHLSPCHSLTWWLSKEPMF